MAQDDDSTAPVVTAAVMKRLVTAEVNRLLHLHGLIPYPDGTCPKCGRKVGVPPCTFCNPGEPAPFDPDDELYWSKLPDIAPAVGTSSYATPSPANFPLDSGSAGERAASSAVYPSGASARKASATTSSAACTSAGKAAADIPSTASAPQFRPIAVLPTPTELAAASPMEPWSYVTYGRQIGVFQDSVVHHVSGVPHNFSAKASSVFEALHKFLNAYEAGDVGICK